MINKGPLRKDKVLEYQSKGLCQIVQLSTQEGVLIAEVSIPTFKKLPAVLIWGSRFFTYKEEDEEYIEGTAFQVMEMSFFGTVMEK